MLGGRRWLCVREAGGGCLLGGRRWLSVRGQEVAVC